MRAISDQGLQEPLLGEWRDRVLTNKSNYTGSSELVMTKANDSEHDLSSGAKLHFEKDGSSNAFAAEGLSKDIYRPIESYEGLHRYDPEFEWTPEEERKVVRKVCY